MDCARTKSVDRLAGGGWRLAVIAIVLIAAMAPYSVRSAPTAREVVEHFQEALLGVWKESGSLSTEARYERLETPVTQAFNLTEMIRVATMPTWKTATEAERAALLTAFTRYSVANWASRFKDYDGQTFATLGEKPGPAGSVIVETQIVRSGEEPVTLSYVVADNGGQPQIIDVVAKGVSELARLRSDYRSTLKTEGPSGLAAKIDSLADDLLAG